MLAIVVCDALCLSRERLLSQLEKAQKRLPDFQFRLATEQELEGIIAKFKPIMLPLVVVGSEIFVGIPTEDDLMKWLLQIKRKNPPIGHLGDRV